MQSRRISALSVLLITQPFGLLLALIVALSFGGDALSVEDAAIGVGAGVFAVLGLGAFYRAMALGSVSVVATIAALGVIVPVAGGFAQGEEPTVIQLLGAAAAIAGVVMVAREPDPEWRAANRTSIGLAAFAAIGFGTFFLGLDLSASGDEPAWTIVAARVGGVATLLVGVATLHPSMDIPSDMWPALVTIGFCDIAANSLFAFATDHGLLALVAVAGSLYSAVTVLLARVFLKERLRGPQRLGVVSALGGVAVIAAGT